MKETTGLLSTEENTYESNPEKEPITKKEAYKALLAVSFSFMLVFTATISVFALQSSINEIADLGVIGLTTNGVGIIVSCLYAPIFVKKFGCKRSLLISLTCQTGIVLAQFYPRIYTLVPGNIISGFLYGPMWTSQSVYITMIAIRYANTYKLDKGEIINHFNGIFWGICLTMKLWGNLISGFILKPSGENMLNVTECGKNYCPYSVPEEVLRPKKPSPFQIYTIMSIFLVFDILAICTTAIFLKKQQLTVKLRATSFKSSVLSTLKAHKNLLFILIIPATIFTAFEQAFMTVEYAQSFVNCAIGLSYVGWFNVILGIGSSISSFLLPKVVKRVGQLTIIFIAFFMNMGLLVFLYLWKPGPNSKALLLTFPALWAITDSAWQNTLPSYLGLHFSHNQESIFAAYRLWQGAGYMSNNGYSPFLCMSQKIIILMSVLVLALIAFTTSKMVIRFRLKKMIRYNDL
ncbi:DgyrCDS779 [Dimorphilus gyrociliatus]|uniref:DgyrCDS779 n=1 Tax=Dimorphilus gyrociliatus TaxID=2664684 RepID=A0A7I8V6W0_9ANNE|nr:DgyrCDS779 [Dimorphilus gyrociliatus]